MGSHRHCRCRRLSDCKAGSAHVFKYFGIPDADFQVVYADGHKPPVYSGWDVEEALDIEWAHAMAPKAKLFLVESKLCMSGTCNTDPYWYAVTVASKLVAKNGGGVISMSWGDAEAYHRFTTTTNFSLTRELSILLRVGIRGSV